VTWVFFPDLLLALRRKTVRWRRGVVFFRYTGALNAATVMRAMFAAQSSQERDAGRLRRDHAVDPATLTLLPPS